MDSDGRIDGFNVNEVARPLVDRRPARDENFIPLAKSGKGGIAGEAIHAQGHGHVVDRKADCAGELVQRLDFRGELPRLRASDGTIV